VSYQFNYGWYKEQKKVVKMDNLLFSFNSVGYVGDKMGTIVIGVNDSKINSVVKMPVSEIEELIAKLNIIYN
jgi:predicted HAD superfamily phosphohydrolase YqeG